MDAHKIIPGLLVTAGVALPVIAAAEFISHVPVTGVSSGGPAAQTTTTPRQPTSQTSPTAQGTTPAQSTPTPQPTRGAGATPTPQPTSAPRPTPTAKPVANAHKTGVFLGAPSQGMFGPVQATLTVRNGKITWVKITAPQDNPTSAYINQQVVPMLRTETLKAQSANINGISGATVTSDAYYQSLQSALTNSGM